jgi:hypothetical protein
MKIIMDGLSWTRAVPPELNRGAPVTLVAKGWRAKLLREQLPRLAKASQAAREGTRLDDKENFSMKTLVRMPGFYRILFHALGQGYMVFWDDNGGEIEVRFIRERS